MLRQALVKGSCHVTVEITHLLNMPPVLLCAHLPNPASHWLQSWYAFSLAYLQCSLLNYYFLMFSIQEEPMVGTSMHIYKWENERGSQHNHFTPLSEMG